MPAFIEPSLPYRVRKAPNTPDWVHEIKHDGYRLMVSKDASGIKLYTRGGHDWSHRFPLIAAAAAKLKADSFLIDGEAAVPGENGVAEFNKMRVTRESRVAILWGFDLLELNGMDLRREHLIERKMALKRLIGKAKSAIMYNEHLEGDGELIFKHACEMGLEGIVSKRVDSTYRSGRTHSWVKVKNPNSPAVRRHG